MQKEDDDEEDDDEDDDAKKRKSSIDSYSGISIKVAQLFIPPTKLG